MSASYQKILLAVDDGPTSEWAREEAVVLACDLGARLAVLHVIDTGFSFPADWNYAEDEVLARKRREGDDLLRHTAARILAELGTRAEALLREGEPASQIVDAARDWGADMIVMGCHARGRLGDLLQGSTTRAVVRDAPCPVLIVTHEPRKIPQRYQAAGAAFPS
jgi:nucleotide-binding universal stress UspA family protein